VIPVQSPPFAAATPHLEVAACLYTPYDAAYVALAEDLDVVLVTADGRLSRVSSVECEIEAIGAAGRS
jgi:predicted nucleic acid-binding protein